jgi:hypothetical protein
MNGRPLGRSALLCALPSIAIALAALLPFLGKAYTSDDVTFLLEAKHALSDPLHPAAFTMVVEGVRMRLSQALVTGPVMAYLLLPFVRFGGAEWMAHAVQIAGLVLAAVATAAMALRFGLGPARASIASLLVVTCPTVLGIAGTAMPDIVAMAFASAAAERLLAWRARRQPAGGVGAAIFLTLAVLSRPHVLTFLGIASVWLLLSARRMGERRTDQLSILAPIAAAAVLIAVAILVTRDPLSGDTVASATLDRIHSQRVMINLGSFLMHWAAAFPLALCWPLLRGKAFLRPPGNAVAFLLGIVCGAFAGYLARNDWWVGLLVVLCIGLSTAALADLLSNAWRRRDIDQLFLGSWLLMALPAVTYVQLPAKLLVPSMPALAILIVGQVPATAPNRHKLFVVGGASLAGLVLGTLILVADASWAEVGRDGGRVVARQVSSGHKVWMDGASGFQWYAMQAGAEPLATTPPDPAPGDVIVAGLYAKLLRRYYPARTLLYRRVYAGPGGRVQGEGAGFFTNWIGPWPWVWGNAEIGRIEVWRLDGPRVSLFQ